MNQTFDADFLQEGLRGTRGAIGVALKEKKPSITLKAYGAAGFWWQGHNMFTV